MPEAQKIVYWILITDDRATFEKQSFQNDRFKGTIKHVRLMVGLLAELFV